jgi:hypothetical protein
LQGRELQEAAPAPTQEWVVASAMLLVAVHLYHEADRFASVVWKYCTQLALQRGAMAASKSESLDDASPFRGPTLNVCLNVCLAKRQL